MPARTATAVCLSWCALASGCADARTSSSFERSFEQADAGAGSPLQLRATWTYRSPEVDVDIELVTIVSESPEACSTTARLRVDEALAGSDVYRLPPTDCAELRLGSDGDLVLLDSPTGHDWSAEAIDVDSDRELIRLGPWHDPARQLSYRFALGARACSDDSACECPRLERRAGDELSALALARRCD
jgi:hypothetical protein